MLTASGSAGSASYGYNGDGQAASVADAAGTTSYTYDSAGRLATLASPATGTTATYSYNPDSQVSGISYGPGNDTQSFGYDGQRRLTCDTLKTSTGTTVASAGYGYNADGQVASETTRGLAGPSTSTYTYDEAGRLTSWNNGTATTQYSYDGNGNLTRDGAKTYTYDARDELTSRRDQQLHLHGAGHGGLGVVAVRDDRGELRRLRRPGQRGDPVVRLRRPRTPDRRHPRRGRQRVPVLLRGHDRHGRRPTAPRRTRGTRPAACWPASVPPAAGPAGPWR